MLKKQKRLKKEGKVSNSPVARRPVTPKIEQDNSDLIALMILFGIETQEQSEYIIYIEQLAFKDWLTGLPNRALFEDRLLNAIAMSNRYKHSVGVMILDLDHFKEINDTYGHIIGDAVLKLLLTDYGSYAKAIQSPASGAMNLSSWSPSSRKYPMLPTLPINFTPHCKSR